jgi:DNA-binding NarL/FixJ family response regulator
VGRGLGRDAAIRLALGEATDAAEAADAAGAGPGRDAADTAAGADAGLLGKREAEVARLVADGLTNRQIGARLFISERTVDSHVRSILTKLGFRSRAQIAAWTTNPGR